MTEVDQLEGNEMVAICHNGGKRLERGRKKKNEITIGNFNL